MVTYEIIGGYRINDENIRLPHLQNPSINELVKYLEYFKNHSGTLVLSNNQDENLTPYNMTLYSDDKRYLVLFATQMEDGDIDVRTFNDHSGSQEFISILGEPYAKASIITDFEWVIQVFKEFLVYGDVNRDLLD